MAQLSKAPAPQPTPQKYGYSGPFDPDKFTEGYAREFKKVPKYNDPSVPDLMFVLRKLGADNRITDIRWAAYILATTFVESSHTIRVVKETKDRRGATKLHKVKVWRNFTPVSEVGRGKGKAYADPVKVFALPTGNARITERDGDQWQVKQSGVVSKMNEAVKMGVKPPGAAAHPIYEADEGDEHLYYGRGYVQLTWWHNYAIAGATLGKGLYFLFHPETVNEPDTAYQIMATGMFQGSIFANRKKLSQYFNDQKTDYVNARNMVNPGSTKAQKQEVGEMAAKFEKILTEAKTSRMVTAK